MADIASNSYFILRLNQTAVSDTSMTLTLYLYAYSNVVVSANAAKSYSINNSSGSYTGGLHKSGGYEYTWTIGSQTITGLSPGTTYNIGAWMNPAVTMNGQYIGTMSGSANFSTTQSKKYLDLNGRLDGQTSGNIAGYGKADVYVGGQLRGSGVTDYYVQWDKGTSYNITNIIPDKGHRYVGVYSGATSGTLNSDQSVVLEFVTNTYSINYDVNGGTGGPSTQTYTYASSGTVTLSSTVPTRAFYDFAGWSYNGATYQPGDAFPKNLATNVTLTAVWSPKAPTNVRVVRTARTGDSISVDILYDGGDITNIKLYYKKHTETKDRYVLIDLGIRNYATVVNLLMDTDYDFYAVVTNPGGMGISGI